MLHYLPCRLSQSPRCTRFQQIHPFGLFDPVSPKQPKKKSRPGLREPRSFDAGTSPADSLDELLKSRYHGAVNIRGIRFQLRYAILRALEMAQQNRLRDGSDPAQAGLQAMLQFEGIEDVDVREGPALRPFEVSDAPGEMELIQVKTAADGWSWHKLAEPVVGFLEAIRTRAAGIRLRLVADFPLRGDLDVLAQYSELPPHRRAPIKAKFVTLVEKVGGTAAEAQQLLDVMRLESIPEDVLRTRTRTALAEVSGAADKEALEAYEMLLIGRSLAWAAERAVITGTDILELLRRFEEGMARQEHYAAVAHRWVGPAEYRADAQPEDFFAGKRVRLGHVAAGLDVPRPEWLRRIEQALHTSGVCVIRAPSGHGKSTLAYRYVIEHWPEGETTVIRNAETAEQVAAIADYLRFRAELGLPVRVLIDADVRTRLWPQVAEAAAAIGAQTLIAVRTEDWHRYALDALTHREILEPTLAREEAEEIFRVFRARGQVHPTVVSAGWAFERLRAPHLLLEYVYLITHGEMLEDRLRDQVREFRRLNEDPKKTEVLRITSLANALGAPVLLNRLLTAVPLRDDPQEVIGSLIGEYITLEDGQLESLHWVRSEHVARLLHEGGLPPATNTALAATPLVPQASLPFLIANALRWEGIDRPTFLAGLVEQFRAAPTSSLLPVIDGLFESGERDFFAANRELFREANELIGSSGLLMISSRMSPVLRVDMIQTVLGLFPEGPGAFPQLQEIADRAVEVPRGLHRVREFLEAVAPARTTEHLRVISSDLGVFLDWCALAGVQLPNWAQVRDELIAQPVPQGLSGEVIADFSQGLFRYDRAAYDEWFARHREHLLACLQLHANCLSLRLVEPSSVVAAELGPEVQNGDVEDPAEISEAGEGIRPQERQDAQADAARYGVPQMDVAVTFAVEGDAQTSHEQTSQRLELLRRTLPAAGRYITDGEYLLPPGITLPFNDTQKRVARWHLPFPSDVRKNVVWGAIVETEFYADTFYRLQERWYEARHLALQIVKGIVTMLGRLLRGRDLQLERETRLSAETVRRLENAFTQLPRTGGQSFERFCGRVPVSLQDNELRRGPDNWISSFQNFRRQFWQYTNGFEDRVGRLLVHNFREANEKLSTMHVFFDALFAESPDYFGMRKLNEQENNAYGELRLLLDGYITDPIGFLTDDPVAELTRREQRRSRDDLARLADALSEYEVVLPSGISHTGALRSTVIGVAVADPLQPQTELLEVVLALASVADVVDWVWLIPLLGGARIGTGAYHINARHLRADDFSDDDVAFATLGLAIPTELPTGLAHLLPDLPSTEIPPPSLLSQGPGLRAAFEMLVQRRMQVERIAEGGDHPCLRELYTRHRQATAEFENEFRDAVLKVRTALDERAAQPDAAEPDVQQSVTELRDFLSIVDRLLDDWTSNSAALVPWDHERLVLLTQSLE